jgi:membrane protease YdiL (CAAX protease family)
MLKRIADAEFNLLVLVSFVAWVFFAIRALETKKIPIPKGRHPTSPIGLWDLFILLALWIGGQVAGQFCFLITSGISIEALTNDSLSREQLSTGILWTKTGEFLALSIGLAYLIFRYQHKITDRFTQNFAANMGVGVVAATMLIPPVLVIHSLLAKRVPYQHTTLDSIAESPAFWTIFVGWLTAVLIAPLTEEFMCRIGIQSWLRRLRPSRNREEFQSWIYGVRSVDLIQNESINDEQFTPLKAIAIIFTAGFFGFLHLGQGLAIVPLFGLALGLGYLFERTGSILPCFVVHFLLNAHSMLWATLGSNT